MKYIATIIILLYSVFSYAQNFEIYNSKSEKTITPIDFLEVGVILNNGENCNNYINFEGRFVSSSQDSLTFNFSKSMIQLELNASGNLVNNYNYINDYAIKVIAKNDITYMLDYKSEKSKKSRDRLSILGGLIMVGGIATTVTSLFLKDNNTSNLRTIGLAQIGAGLIVSVGFNKRSKKFNTQNNDPWKIR